MMAPPSFKPKNSGGIAMTRAPNPRATAKIWTPTPAAFPRTEMMAARFPHARARPMEYNTLGPGMTMITNARSVNATRLDHSITAQV